MEYKQQAGRANVESAAINYLTDGDKKKKKKEGKSNTTTTSVSGVTNPDFPNSRRKGTLYTETVTTTIDGTSGKRTPGKPGTGPFKNPALPNQTYQEFMDAPEGSPGKPKKPTKTPDTPGSSSSTSTSYFQPDLVKPVSTLKPYGIKTQTPEIKAPAIKGKPFSDLVAISTSKGGGGSSSGDSNRPRRMMTTLNDGGQRERTMEETVVTRDEASRLKSLVRYNNDELKEKYSPENITKNWKGNAKGLKGALERGKNLIANNLSTVDSFRDVYDAEASTMIGGRTRVANKNRPANQAAEKAKRIAKKKNLDTAKATKKAAVAKNRASTIATRRTAIDKKNKEKAAKIAARKRN
jgi:hypothetical protein